jgi:hypothetical protein
MRVRYAIGQMTDVLWYSLSQLTDTESCSDDSDLHSSDPKSGTTCRREEIASNREVLAPAST